MKTSGTTKTDRIEEVLRGSRQWAYLKGDSEEIVTMIPPFSIDAQISDPPYPGIKRSYGCWSEEEWMAMMATITERMRRKLTISGSSIFILQPNYKRIGSVAPWIYEFLAYCARTWNIVQDAYWLNYVCLPSAGATSHGLMRGVVKHCVWLGSPSCYRNQEAVLWGESDEGRIRRAAARCERKPEDPLHVSPSGHKRKRMKVHEAAERRGGVTPFNIWPVANNRSTTGHGAETPIELARKWVRYICPPGGVVLDCFAGSANIGIAALLEGRRYIGIEKNDDCAAKGIAALVTHEAGEDQ